ncbi:MAG TPA: adenosylmethionine--8-amino-7-oxononanoate transaminase [Flavobacteriales bacterium]|nr:adenosylmethionine--8-amino-7-oxononanoate transaminase [Flavobacteriales bacterium]
MTKPTSLQQKDVKYIWHPFTQMKTADYPIVITKGKDALLFDEKGNAYLDVVSSWWVNLHGHANEYIAKAVSDQLYTLEHVIFAGFTNPKAIEISERLLNHLPFLSKAFFSDNGSTAVEVGIKMALQYWHNQNNKKTRIIALQGAYHGDTFGAMSVTARTPFNQSFEKLLFDVDYLPFPTEENFESILIQFKQMLLNQDVAAFIVEPLVQGASGMRMYSAEYLDKLFALAHQYDALCIADEVMTGFGRTGKMFAADYLDEKPDIICLSKGITGGTMAMGMTLCTQQIYDAFLSDDVYKTFFHGHSYTANPLTCAAACASLDLLEDEQTQNNILRINQQHAAFYRNYLNHPAVKEMRVLGTILALEVKTLKETSYFNELNKTITEFFLQKNILIRPLGNVIYLIPPYCITDEQLKTVYSAIAEFLDLQNKNSKTIFL